MPQDKDAPVPLQGIQEYTPKVTMKKQGSPSMFDNQPRKPTPQEFQQKVQEGQETLSGYKKRTAELFIQFKKSMADKTLGQNRNIFNRETEKEMLQNMMKLAEEINNDPNEPEGTGSSAWILLLLTVCLSQRDRMNELEYALESYQKKVPAALNEAVKKEIALALDKKKESE